MDWFLWQNNEDIQFGGFIDEMNSIRVIHDDDGEDMRIVYGDRLGLIHVVRFKDDRFQEEWVSPKLRGPIAQVFIDDVNDDEMVEVLAYTELGEIIIFSAAGYQEVWRSTDDEFESISGKNGTFSIGMLRCLQA